MFTEAKCQILGKVQGVGYRDFAQVQAKACGITGWVKNNSDGTVSVLAQGLPDDMKRYIEELHEGSILAEVTTVSVDWGTVKEPFSDFVVIYT